MIEKMIVGIIIIGIGLVFFFNNKKMGVGCAEFYRKLYTKKSMPFMFKAAGILLIIGGIILIILSSS